MNFAEVSFVEKMIIEDQLDEQDIIESSKIDGVSEGE